MSSYEKLEADVSAILDDELRGESLRGTIDALLEDEELRNFWRANRTLSKSLEKPRGAEGFEPLPADGWTKVRRKSGLRRPKVYLLHNQAQKSVAVAATILLAIVLSVGTIIEFPFINSAGATTVTLGDESGNMSEKRFIELTTELLEADHRYHRKMLEIMELVNQEAYNRGAEDRSETRLASSTNTEVDADNTTARRNNNQNSGGNNNPIEFNLW